MALLKKDSKKIALLIDPEDYREETYLNQKEKIQDFFDLILIGGSSDALNQIKDCIHSVKTQFELPIYIFPGSHEQISEEADGMLYISLISGDNALYLIGEHRKSALALKKMNLDILPTGYLLIDGGHTSAVERVSNTKPIAQENLQLILESATAGELLGMKAIYLEAGSGASISVNPSIIHAVSQQIDIPLIVGGGIRSRDQINLAFENGANLVVIGTFIEENSANIDQLKS